MAVAEGQQGSADILSHIFPALLRIQISDLLVIR